MEPAVFISNRGAVNAALLMEYEYVSVNRYTNRFTQDRGWIINIRDEDGVIRPLQEKECSV